MSAAAPIPQDLAAEVDDLLDVVFGDNAVLPTRRLAERLGVSCDTVKDAARRGDLVFLHVSARRLAASRTAVRRWLLSLQGGG